MGTLCEGENAARVEFALSAPAGRRVREVATAGMHVTVSWPTHRIEGKKIAAGDPAAP
jgi:hypothetical protein